MDAVLNITAPIFLLIFLGYLGVRYKLMPSAALAGLSRFVLYFALPALVVSKLLAMDLSNAINLSYMVIYAVGGLATMSFTVFLSYILFKDSWVLAGVRGVGATMPNSAFIGFPVLLQLFPHPPTQAFAMSIMIENIVLLPAGLIFIETVLGKGHVGEEGVGWKIAKRVSSNPIIISVALGLMGAALGVSLPTFALDGLDMLSQASAPVALIVIGGSLVGVSIKGSLGQMSFVATAKLIFFPLVVFGLLMLTPNLEADLKAALLLFAAMPMFSTYPIICSEYGTRSFCSSSLLVTTVASFFTLSIVLRYFV